MGIASGPLLRRHSGKGRAVPARCLSIQRLFRKRRASANYRAPSGSCSNLACSPNADGA